MTDTTAMMTIDSNSTAPVNWTDSGLQIGAAGAVGWGDVSTYWSPAVPLNNYIYTSYPSRPNPTEVAFRIVSRLMEDGIVEGLNVKKFVKLIDDVAEIVRSS